jgi:putative membrane protein
MQKGTEMMGWYGDGLHGAAPFMWIGMGLFWIVLIGLVVFLVVRLLPGGATPTQPPVAPGPRPVESAEEILDRMFATGEIDEQTYRARRGALSEMRKQS